MYRVKHPIIKSRDWSHIITPDFLYPEFIMTQGTVSGLRSADVISEHELNLTV